MLELLWLIPVLPFAGAAFLLLFGPRLGRAAVAAVGCGSIAASAVLASLIAVRFIGAPPAGNAYQQVLWTWIGVGNLRPDIGFHLDALSLVMTLVVTWVGFLIHVYSIEYMAGDEGYSRFFGYMNLFVGSMLTLVLGNNLLLLFLGWEGVGLCSYLLIGFWYTVPANGTAAQKAFIVTRVGDTAMTVGLFILFYGLGTLHIQEMLRRAPAEWASGSGMAIAAAALLLGGAVGKSAQLPLQTWLPDAMAGPTPTSALIHAATMVTAGVYLIARTHVIFTLAPPVQFAVAVVGALTLLMAGFSALTQDDIKRVLAYSTISQIGYMFLALGVAAWSTALFHFMTHAFFKALLFMAAGVVIEAMHHEQNIFRMGGLRTSLPIAFWIFVIGGAALSGVPFTSGYFSKELIVWSAWASPIGNQLLWGAAVAGVLLTSLYTSRLIFLVFFGNAHGHVAKRPGAAETIPLLVLAVLSIAGGYIGNRFLAFLNTALPAFEETHPPPVTEGASGMVATAALVLGVALAYLFYLRNRGWAEAAASGGLGRALHRLWYTDWGMDWFYDRVFVRPVQWAARVNKSDFVDAFYAGLAWLGRLAWGILGGTETGRVRWYAAGLAGGAVVLVAITLLL
ncbi:MAG TPA: NADH-quinone oxidoreductase subunit L [Bryobacteraceae bacterium]|nr:NADH-quinone oxidoreductase subunit L [Bryobacteraceae bacterium]